MRYVKATFAWIALAAIAVVALSNLHEVTVTLPSITLEAPVAYVIALAAVLGALGSSGFWTVLRWAKPKPKPGERDDTATTPAEATPAEAPGLAAAPEAAASLIAIGAGATDVGKTRDHNEDCLVVDDELGLYTVCDGMGGHAAGEVAAAIAGEHVRGYLAARRDELADADRCTTLVSEAAASASRAILDRANAEPDLTGMGCTMTALIMCGNGAIMAHVGDSRLYRLRDGAVEQLSADHTLADELVAAGALSETEARSSPYGHTVTRCLGHKPDIAADTRVVHLQPGDRYVLCSDGFSNYADSAEQLAELLAGDLDGVPGRAIAYANEQGGADNITVLAVDIRERPAD